MLETILESLGQVFTLPSILFMAIGVFIGIVFGAIPGLNGGLAIVVLLPITFSMPPVESILMLLGVYCAGVYGGSISAVLIGTPGTTEAAATVLDGHPLAMKGYPNRALNIALNASFFGGIVGAIALLLFAPVISRYAMMMGPPEYFAIAFLGLAIIAGISGKSVAGGIISACIGTLLATIGLDTLTGAQRFVFNNVNLLSGLPLLPVLLGVFAMPDIFKSLHGAVAKVKNKTKSNIVSKPDDKVQRSFFKRCIGVLLKSSVIGTIIGAIPGAGAAIAAFLGYAEAKSSSGNPSEFGRGAEAGIAAPESANNAVTASSFIPLLTMGIPGSVVAAILSGALTMHGVAVGPMMMKNQGVWFYTIIIGFIVIQFVMLVMGKACIKLFKNIIKVPRELILPILAIFCMAGAYIYQRRTFDIGSFIVIGALFYFLQKFGASGPPFVLGYILGPIIEFNLSGSLVMGRGSWLIFLKRPVCVIFLILSILPTVVMYRQNKKCNKMVEEEKVLQDAEIGEEV